MTPVTTEKTQDYTAFLQRRANYVCRRRAGATREELAPNELDIESLQRRVDASARAVIESMGGDHTVLQEALQELLDADRFGSSRVRISALTESISILQEAFNVLKEDETLKKDDIAIREMGCQALLDTLGQLKATLKKVRQFNPSVYKGFDERSSEAGRYGAELALRQNRQEPTKGSRKW